jgi:alpha-1,2-mannosyltransferase
VNFAINASFEQLKNYYKNAQFGLHSMWCEHFGIGVVELMASGVIVIAHNSGGPKSDIVVPYKGQQTGCLATTAEEYAEKLAELLQLNPSELEKVIFFIIEKLNFYFLL